MQLAWQWNPDAVTQERSEARKDVARCAELNPKLRAQTSLNARSLQPQKEIIQREGRPHRLFPHPQPDLAASSAMCNGSEFKAEHSRKRLYLMRKGKNESNFFWAEMQRYSITSPRPESIMQVQSHRHWACKRKFDRHSDLVNARLRRRKALCGLNFQTKKVDRT